MRKLLLAFSFILLVTVVANAQAPAFFNYQGVARNSVGNALVNKTITLRLTIHDGGALGIPTYTETRKVTTNAFGLFSVQVGGAGATNISGSIAGTNWNTNTKWMQVEIDTEGGTNLKDVGTTQLTSVPYSLFTSQSGDIVLPFNKSQGEEAPLFRLINTNNNANSLAYEGLSSSTANNAAAIRGIITSVSPGTFSAGLVGQNNGTGANGIGVFGNQNGTGWGVYGTTPGGVGVYGNSTSGMGVYGQSVSGVSVMGYQPNTGTNNAGYFQNFNQNNTAAALRVLTNGGGTGVGGEGLTVTTTGFGKAIVITTDNVNNGKTVLEATTNGSGKVGFLQNTNTGNINNVFEVQTNGTGRTALFNSTNAANTANTFEVSSTGTGFAANIINTNAAPKALHTTGAIRFNGVNEGPLKLLSTVDGSGNATWQSAAAMNVVSGNGTLNWVPKWTPDGTVIGNSQIFDDGTKVSIGGAVDPVYKITMNGTMKVKANSIDSAIAIFENTSGANQSDGIIIKLGKTHPRWTGSSYAEVPNPMTGQLTSQTNLIKDWIYGNASFNTGQLYNLIPAGLVYSTMCNITNFATSRINSLLGLPLTIGPYGTPEHLIVGRTQIAPGIPMPPGIPDIPAVYLPALTLPALPVIPQVTVMPAIPGFGCGSLPGLSFPNFVFNDVTNTLTKENEYISFLDKDNRKLGAIRAQSIQNFSYDYFDGQKLLEIAGELIGIDLADDVVSTIAAVSSMVNDYNNIGVEYSSGNGDYAEWLERADAKEEISYGDIVAVKGGKISKDLSGAEQIMAVSKKPIVLGNIPDESKTKLGNNIAFMGQIPVKVIGAVQSGDYIVAKSNIPGYGVAVHPKDMKVEDFKLAVGRSWDSNLKEGPKMVNTVVGVHNHDFINIIGGLQQKADQADERLKKIETMLNIQSATTTEQTKKGFK